MDFVRAGDRLRFRLLVELRNLCDREDTERLWFRYVAVGPNGTSSKDNGTEPIVAFEPRYTTRAHLNALARS
jgi:hypothetical protein